MKKSLDLVFICSSIVFNISVSALYVAAKLGDTAIMQVSGAIAISLIVPFTITLLGYVRKKEKVKTLISNVIVLFYLSLEIVLDYILRIPFREISAIHVPYIMVFYAALFSMIGVSLEKDRRMAAIVIVTFLMLMGCLIFYLLPV